MAMLNKPECNKPPMPVDQKQSFSMSCYNENRNPLVNNMKAIAQIFARKIIAQMLSPLYQDEVLYFISHRRADGERIAAKLADELRLLTRERNVYRDVVCVEVGDDAQKDIDEHLKISDVLIFVQTEQAQDSPYIMKELCYALVYNIPILWIQIDDASYSRIKVRPGEKPLLKYRSDEFENHERLIEIVDEIEENCFQLIMNSSNQVYSYVEYLHHMKKKNEIKLASDRNAVLAYQKQQREQKEYLWSQYYKGNKMPLFGEMDKEYSFDEELNGCIRNRYDKIRNRLKEWFPEQQAYNRNYERLQNEWKHRIDETQNCNSVIEYYEKVFPNYRKLYYLLCLIQEICAMTGFPCGLPHEFSEENLKRRGGVIPEKVQNVWLLYQEVSRIKDLERRKEIIDEFIDHIHKRHMDWERLVINQLLEKAKMYD